MHKSITDLIAQSIHSFKNGELGNAESFIKSAIALQPYNVDALRIFATLRAAQNDLPAAIDLYTKAHAIDPQNPTVCLNLAKALTTVARDIEALPYHQKAVTLIPGNGDGWFNYGYSLTRLGRYNEALSCFDKVISINPGHLSAWINRGIAMDGLQRYQDALASYDKAIGLNPVSIEAWCSRGVTLHKIKRYDDALSCFDKALNINPRYAEAWHKRGGTFQELRNYIEAFACYDRALDLDPEINFLCGRWLHHKMMLCQWDRLDEAFHKVFEQIALGKKTAETFNIIATPASPAIQQQCARTYIADRFPDQPVDPSLLAYPRKDKIRIGYFSADFHDHATTYLMAEMFEHHDRARFEIIAFSFGPDKQDAMRQRMVATFDNFIDVRNQSDPEIAVRARSMEIDIAVDLKGFTGDSRTGIFAHHAAPLQVNFLGYPGTMGAPYIDYIIADRVLIDEDSAQFYDEKIVYLPNSYQPNDRHRKISDRIFTKAEVGLPESGFVFCCFNNNYKITPDVFDIWMRLLAKIPGSVLWLFEGNKTAMANLRREAVQRGINADRLVFAGRLDLPEHLARHRLADLFVDTIHCNAHTTASDALWAGLPVLTCLGSSFAGRVAASLLTAAGLPELITHSHDDYEALAYDLATHPERLATIRDTLHRNRMTCPLFDAALFTQYIEGAYTGMHTRHVAGLLPDHIYVHNGG